MPAVTTNDDLNLNPKALWLSILVALITAVISFPLYQINVERQTQKEARKALNKDANLQQDYYSSNGMYADQVVELAYFSIKK